MCIFIINIKFIKHETNQFKDFIPKSSLTESRSKSRSRRSSIEGNSINNSIINDLNMIKSRINNNYISIDEYNKIKEELDKQIKINEQLNNKINELQNLLLKENIKNSDLQNQISNFTEEKKKSFAIGNKMNESFRKTTNDLDEAKKKIEKYLKSLKDLNLKIQEKNAELVNLYKKNSDLKTKLSRFPFELEENENIIIVIFQSNEDQKTYPIICKNTEIFSEIEIRLKNKFTSLKEQENFYLHNGKKINKYKNLEDNKISDCNTIVICNVCDDL